MTWIGVLAFLLLVALIWVVGSPPPPMDDD
jgi:hypothetical protein